MGLEEGREWEQAHLCKMRKDCTTNILNKKEKDTEFIHDITSFSDRPIDSTYKIILIK